MNIYIVVGGKRWGLGEADTFADIVNPFRTPPVIGNNLSSCSQ